MKRLFPFVVLLLLAAACTPAATAPTAPDVTAGPTVTVFRSPS